MRSMIGIICIALVGNTWNINLTIVYNVIMLVSMRKLGIKAGKFNGLYEFTDFSLNECKVLIELGLQIKLGETVITKSFIQKVAECAELYKKLYVTKTELKSLQQMCIDKCQQVVPFPSKVSRIHLKLPKKWFKTIESRIRKWKNCIILGPTGLERNPEMYITLADFIKQHH